MYCGWCCWHNCSIECTAVLFCAVNCPLRLYEVWSRHIITDYSLLYPHQYTVRSIYLSIYLFIQLLVSRETAQNNSHYLTCMKSLFLSDNLFGFVWSEAFDSVKFICLITILFKKDIYSVHVYDIHSTIICHIYKLLIYIVVFIYEHCYQHAGNLLKSDKLI